jgi:uncharacterized protein YbjT (DUF2867 family)
LNRVLIIGATGNVGREVVSQLSTAGVRVRALTRKPEAARFPPEVEVVRGDLAVPGKPGEVPGRCRHSLSGVDRTTGCWCSCCGADREVCAARSIPFLSAQDTSPLLSTTQSLAVLQAQIERMIETLGLDWTFLRPGIFAANSETWWAPQIRAGGVVRWPLVGVHTAPIHEFDIAAVAVRVLCEGGHAKREYVLTGPESLGADIDNRRLARSFAPRQRSLAG